MNFRDALAHRIPLYVPPSAMTSADLEKHEELRRQMDDAEEARDFDRASQLLEEQQQLGTIFPVYVHSFGDKDAAPPTYFHPQAIVDAKTLKEIIVRVAGL